MSHRVAAPKISGKLWLTKNQAGADDDAMPTHDVALSGGSPGLHRKNVIG